MKVERLAHGREAIQEVREDINRVFTSQVQGRVCGAVCSKVCSKCGSISCQCECSRDCADAPGMLSSDPVNYPVEPGIAPLVYEMQRSGLYRPCWSCEGHARNDGGIWKLPQVWFYCDSVVHIRILADTLKALKFAKKIQSRWEVHIEFSEPGNPDTTFALRPNLEHGESYLLTNLQRDARAIAEALEPMMRGEGKNLQGSLPHNA